MIKNRVINCQLLDKCTFYNRYKSSEDPVYKKLIASYCNGSMMYMCRRRKYYNRHGYPPAKNMTPRGYKLLL